MCFCLSWCELINEALRLRTVSSVLFPGKQRSADQPDMEHDIINW